MSLFNFFSKKSEAETFVSAVIVAAGSSSRMGGENKLLMELASLPVLVHTIKAFEACQLINEIILCCREQDISEYNAICKYFNITKVTKIVVGGNKRTKSVLNGVLETNDDCEIIAVHDGARPLVSQEIIEETIEMAIKHRAAAPAVKPKDSLKQAINGEITANIDRNSVVLVQTPQVFEKNLLKDGLNKAISENLEITDDCSAVELLGITTKITEGSYNNIKITTPEDIDIAECIIARINL